MNQTYRKFLMWTLFGLLFLLVMLLQTTVFGRTRFFGVKLNLIPVVIVCISMGASQEAGGLFGLLAAFFWYAAGAADGTMSFITFTITGILSGYLCSNWLAPHFLPALVLSCGALLFHEGSLFLLRFYLGAAGLSLFRWVLLTTALSLLSCPFLYFPAKFIRKAGCVQ